MEHISICSDCRKVHEEMQNLNTVINSAKPLYNKKKINSKKIRQKIAACVAGLVIFSVAFGGYSQFIPLNPQDDPEIADLVNNSIFNQMNLPTDEYGILNPDKEVAYEQSSYE
jgi:hypothetical protein